MSHLSHSAAAVLAAASIVLLAGCTAYEPFAVLQSEREALDELPQLEDYSYDAVDVSSSRFVGEHDGTSLWLAQGLEASTVCLIADPGDDDWIVACGGAPIRAKGGAGTFEVVPDGAIAPEGATQVSENVYAW